MPKSDAYRGAVDVAGKAMQLHGGIGYTWESGIHVYLKRALLNRSLLGFPVEHRRQLAKRYSSRETPFRTRYAKGGHYAREAVMRESLKFYIDGQWVDPV